MNPLVVQSLSIAVPLLVASGGALWGFVIYLRQKKTERLEDLRTKRRDVYSQFLGLVVRMTQPGQHMGEYQRLKSEIILFGSDDSVRALKQFCVLIEVGNPQFSSDSAVRLAAYSELVAKLRRDVFPETQLQADQLRTLTPFGDDRLQA